MVPKSQWLWQKIGSGFFKMEDGYLNTKLTNLKGFNVSLIDLFSRYLQLFVLLVIVKMEVPAWLILPELLVYACE